MAAPREIKVKITADTREFKRAMLRTQIIVTRSRWRRLLLRLALWRLDRKST